MSSNRQILLYGGGGIGKTNMLSTLAKWNHRAGKKTRVITVDGGGIGPLEAGIDIGAVDAIQCDSWPYPFRYMDMLSRGYWPQGDNRFVAPWNTLVPPDKQSDWNQVGAICIEGMTAVGLTLMNYMRDRRARGEQIGQMDGKNIGMFKDGDKADGGEVALGGNVMTDYGISQSYLNTYTKNFRQLWARSMPIVVWTALELKATDDSKVPVYGPMLPGKAATAACIPWFTDVLHLDVLNPTKQPDGTISGARKVFLTNHYANGDTVPYLAKTSANKDGKMPSIIDPDFKIFFDEIEKANARTVESWK